MNELIAINNDTQTVSARELHEKLEVASRFSRWFESNKELFVEGEDYNKCTSSTVVNNGAIRELEDYNISILMANHICLMSRTEKGKEVRNYLIDLEKAWNTPEQILSRALRIADHTISNLKLEVAEMKPKADFFDAVADSKDAIPMSDVAKVLAIPNVGRNKLFEILRDNGVLQANNVPYQRYIDRGWFRTVEQKYTINDEVRISIMTLVYQKGVDGIRKMVS